MPFDVKKFEQAQYETRSGDVDVPELAEFFDEGEKPVWKVRNLTAPEIAKVEMSAKTNEGVLAIVTALMSDSNKEKAEAIKDVLGLGGKLEPVFIKQLTKIELATVGITINRQTVVKIANVSPNAFYRIVNAIDELSGKGAVLGKQISSSEIQKSETH